MNQLSQQPRQQQFSFESPKDARFDFFFFEQEARSRGHSSIAGVDEAGRGPLAGPVVVAACILPQGLQIEGVNDSKQLSSSLRHHIFEILTNHPDIVYAWDVVSHEVIDKINIFRATLLGMQNAVKALRVQPDYVLVDGPHSPYFPMPARAIIKGDSLSHSIACASILAKETRDRIMVDYDKEWPMYAFAKHKGYSTPDHLSLLREHGPCPIHRKSFAPVRDALSSFFSE